MLFKLFSITVTSYLLFIPFYSYSFFDHFYEQCDWKNRELTQRIIDESSHYCTVGYNHWPQCLFEEPISLTAKIFPTDECLENPPFGPNSHQIENLKKSMMITQIASNQEGYEIPNECFLSSAIQGINQFPPETSDYNYCKSANSDQLCKSMTFNNQKLNENVCSQNSPSEIANRPPCLNKRYINHIARNFNQMANCFDFKSQQDKERLFALMHHESRFLLNKIEEPPCYASCRNKKGKCNMKCQKQEKEERGHISTARCFGQIQNKVIYDMNKYIYFGNQETSPYVSKYKGFRGIYNKALNRCPFLKQAITPNPEKFIGKLVDSSNGNTFKSLHLDEKKESIICKTSQDPTPCLFYTMFYAKINMKYISDSLELNNNQVKLNEEEVSLFEDEEKLKWAFVLYAHNGGSKIARFHSNTFIKQLKKKISKPTETKECQECKKCTNDCKNNNICANKCKCEDCKDYMKYRASILAKKPLKTNILYTEFRKFLKENNIGDENQLHDFVPNVMNDLKIFSKGSSLEESIKHLHKDNPKIQTNMDNFLNHIKEECPTSF